MSLRDYFAGQVDIPWNAVHEHIRLNQLASPGEPPTVELVLSVRARLKWMEADAMLLARDGVAGLDVPSHCYFVGADKFDAIARGILDSPDALAEGTVLVSRLVPARSPKQEEGR